MKGSGDGAFQNATIGMERDEFLLKIIAMDWKWPQVLQKRTAVLQIYTSMLPGCIPFHSAPHKRGYCTTTGGLRPLPAGFKQRVQALLSC
jgi:hypothetical protein